MKRQWEQRKLSVVVFVFVSFRGSGNDNGNPGNKIQKQTLP
jgi:hypothetical protein